MNAEHYAHTPAEKRAIDAAFSAITHAADCWTWTAPDYLRRALKAGKEGGRRGQTEAKALVVRAFAAGATEPMTPADMFGLMEAYQLAHMTGAAYAKSYPLDSDRSRLAEIIALAPAAEAANEAAHKRWFAARCDA